MKIDCDVIKDLLPLYVENIASEASRNLVEEHCRSCESCKKVMESMGVRDMKIESSMDGFKKAKRDYKKHVVTIVACAIYLTLVVVATVEGKVFLDPSDAMGYGLLYLYVVLPFGAMICSGLLGTQKNRIKYIMPCFFGGVGILFPWILFESTDVIFFFVHFVPSLIGLGIGCLVRKISKK